MIRAGDYYANESAPGVLRVRSIRCLTHGPVYAARMVLGAEPPHEREWTEGEPETHHARVTLCCPYCTRSVVVVLDKLERPPGRLPAMADMPITTVPPGTVPEGTK